MLKNDKIYRKDIVARLSNELSLDESIVNEVVLGFLTDLREYLVSGKDVSFSYEKLGQFVITRSNPRKVRLPKSDKLIDVPEKRRVKFRPSRSLMIDVDKERSL